jgi:hypothetical protein
MEHPTLSPGTLVADLLAASPLAAGALVELRTDCVGCSMNRFCTLQEMCNQYELEFESVVKFLQERMESHASD